MWVFKTRVGLFKIIPMTNGRYGLWINEELLGSYHAPHAAADDVYMCTTGHWPWDQQMTIDYPCELGDWQQLAKCAS